MSWCGWLPFPRLQGEHKIQILQRRFVFRASHKGRGICYFISFPHGISNYVCFDCICRWPTKSRGGEWCMYWVFWNVLDTNRIISSCPGIATNAILPCLLIELNHWFASLHHLGIWLWKAFLLIEEASLLLELQKTRDVVRGCFALSQELVICNT